ncbi:hypothetical protein ACP4OV_009024 [Aristida adscensionis]
MGKPRGMLDDVSRIRRGAALFLFDFDAKYLYGPYRADSDGGLDLVPDAFGGHLPAQVKFKIEGVFIPLRHKGNFKPELTYTQRASC